MTTDKNRYEHPQPILSIDISHIEVSVGSQGGSFNIKNTGGGTLSGRIQARSPSISFSPQSWSGNMQEITYSFLPEEHPSGSFETVAYVSSNGGEIKIPISISNTPMTIHTEDDTVIASLEEFYNYAGTNPKDAMRIFVSSEFYMLLLSTGNRYMPVYESLHKDPNRERAMDNFFIVSGLKKKTTLVIEKQCIDIVATGTNKVYEYITVQKSDSGYADAPVTVAGGATWINLSTNRLVSSDFDEANRSLVGFSVDPLRVTAPFIQEHILVGTQSCEITFRRGAAFNMRLNRTGYRYEDRGILEVTNNTGVNMTLDVYCQDRYIRFNAASYLVIDKQSIPFEIRPTAMASAQRLFRRLPYVSSYIDVRAHGHGCDYRKRLHFNIGEW